MRPLQKSEIKSFLERFDNFTDGEFRSLIMNSPFNFTLTFTVQDSARSFDWISIKIEFDQISDASLVDDSNLALIDMSDGINITYDGTNFAFKINSSTFYITSSSIKYEEGAF
jgi:hypothetical protein